MIYKKYGVSTVMKPSNTVRQALVHPKDKISKEKTSGVIYRIPCDNCSEKYIGETGREYGARKKEHKTDVEKNSKTKYTRASRKESMSEMNKSAITDHVNKLNHVINRDDDKILGKEQNRKKRNIKEAIHIRREANTMNRDEGNHQLSHAYDNFIMLDGSTSQLSSHTA